MSIVTTIGDSVPVNAVNSGVVGIAVTANTNVTFVIEGTIDGATWSTLTAFAFSGTAGITSITTTGLWAVSSAGLTSVRARVTAAGATPSANIQLTPSTATMQGLTTMLASGVPITGVLANAFGALTVTTDATTQFSDPFDGGTLDTTARWTTQLATGTIVQSGGGLTIDSSTTGSAYAALSSKPTFPPNGVAPQVFGFIIQIENPVKANVRRFWGIGSVPGTPTTAVPITDGIGFELTEAGVFRAVIYSAGAVLTSSPLTLPTDGGLHGYAIAYRGDAVVFYIDTLATAVAFFAFQYPSVLTLPLCILAVNGVTPPTAGAIFKLNQVGVGDSGKNSNTLSDGTLPFRKATVNSGGSLQVLPEPVTTIGPFTGLSTVNTDLISNTVNGWYDAANFKSGSVTVFTPAGITGGIISFEQTNDPTNAAAGVALYVFDVTSISSLAIANTTVAASTIKQYDFPITSRYVRFRISTAITGATVGATSVFSQAPYATTRTNIIATSLTPGTGAANLGKAEDAASASGDTGVFALAVRRDTLTTSASATGDYNEIAVSKLGSVNVIQYEKMAKTYSAAATFTAAAAATDIAALFGNVTTTVYITKVIISATQTTGGLQDIQLVKRSTANSGGTSAAMTAIPHDASDTAASSIPISYTANPTPGTAVGTLRRGIVPIAGVTAAVNPIVEFDFGERGRPITLSGTAQGLCVSAGGATLTGNTFDICFEYFEI